MPTVNEALFDLSVFGAMISELPWCANTTAALTSPTCQEVEMADSRLCSVEGCGKPVERREWCKAHYERWRRGKTVEGKLRCPKGTLLRWLADNVAHASSECLTWPFATVRGYGAVSFRGVRTGAHRVMCILAHGEPPSEEHWATHSCGKGDEGCVNPLHLRWAMPVDNHADAKAHGTACVGERHGRVRIGETEVRAIRALGGAMSQRNIGAKFGISQGQVKRILSRENWGHIL